MIIDRVMAGEEAPEVELEIEDKPVKASKETAAEGIWMNACVLSKAMLFDILFITKRPRRKNRPYSKKTRSISG